MDSLMPRRTFKRAGRPSNYLARQMTFALVVWPATTRVRVWHGLLR